MYTQLSTTLGRLLAGVALIWSLAFGARAQTFTTGRIDYGDGSANVYSACAQGPDGKFYALMLDGNFVQSSSQTMPRFHLLRWEPGTTSWTLINTILANTIPNMYVNPIADAYTMVYDRVGLKIDSQGVFHAMLRLQLTTTGETIMYARSTNGVNWTYTPVEADNNIINYSFGEVQMELDQNERPHMVFRISNVGQGGVSSRVYSIRHQYFNGTSWVGETVYSQGGGTGSANELSVVDFAMDPNGKVHVAFSAELNGSGTDASLLYVNNKTGSWPAPTNLAQGVTNGSACNTVTMTVDASGKVHILRRDLNYNIFYHTDKSGSWTSTQVNGGLKGTFDNCSLMINTNGDLITLYNAQTNSTSYGEVRYACLFNGANTWQTGAVFTGIGQNTGRFFAGEFGIGRVAMFLFDHYSGAGSPSYGPPNAPRELEYATATINPPGPAAPTVTTATQSSVTATSATLGGNVTADGGGTVTERGIVWAATAAPTTANNKVVNGSGLGAFSGTVSGLPASTLVYVRAYAINAGGTSYGSQISFSTPAANNAPTNISLANGSVNQSAGVNGVVGTLSASDADVSDTHTFTLVAGAGSTDNGSFNLSGSSLRANDASALAAGVYSIRVQANDGHGGTFAKALSVTVVDDIAPVITSSLAASGTYGSPFAYTILASGAPVSFGAVNLAGNWSLNPITGEIAGNATNAGVFNIVLSATDAAGNTGYATNVVTIAKLTLIAIGDNATRCYGVTNPVFTGNLTGGLPADNLTASFDCTATTTTIWGDYPIVPNINDPDGKLANYDLVLTNGTLTITAIPLVLTIETLPVPVVPENAPVGYVPEHPTRTRISAIGDPGRSYAFLVSSNLTDWSVLTNVIADSNGVLAIEDWDFRSHEHRFFRARAD